MSGFLYANLKKAVYYWKRNGLRDTYLAALDRLTQKEERDYVYEQLSEETLQQQREWAGQHGEVKFSLLVPAYRTPERYLAPLLASVQAQTYGNWELILADAGASEETGEKTVQRTAEAWGDPRIRYLRLLENGGISVNTNAALAEATGNYIGLLDHDDLLTPDALYEMAREIQRAEEEGTVPRLLYSDEDKCGEDGTVFYEVHRKPDFDPELLLSNNYICHFTVMEAGLMKKLGFRKEFDGAQDHDLVLRAAGELLLSKEGGLSVEGEVQIRHIPRVLYHWRCHEDSTAANPLSKQYAYEAGRRAAEAFLRDAGIDAVVRETPHLGFFRVDYMPDMLTARPDVGIVGGKPLNRKGRVMGLLENLQGRTVYAGMGADRGGYLHRALLQQDMQTVDVRLMRLTPALYARLKDFLQEQGFFAETDEAFPKGGVRLKEEGGRTEAAYDALSRELCSRARAAGYRIVLDPAWKEKIG